MEASKSPNEEEFEKLAATLRQFLEQKPYVPENVEDRLYRRFLHSCYYDLDKAKVAGDLFFSTRSSSPELFTDRDPLSLHMQKAMKISNICKYRISGNRNLWVFQLNDPGCHQYDYSLDAKFLNMCADAWLLEDDFFQESDITISDCKDVCFRIMTKLHFSVVKKMFTYQQEAIPFRIKDVHIVNAPRIVHRLFSMLKPFIKKEIYDAIHFHPPGSTTLYDYFSREELLEDFGGTRGKVSEQFAKTLASFMRNKDRLTDDNLWRVDSRTVKTEKKERVDSKSAQARVPTEINSLRTLSID